MPRKPWLFRVVAWGVVSATALLTIGHVYAQMVTGERLDGYTETTGILLNQRSYPYKAQLITCSAPGNVLWPGDKPTFTF